MINPKPSSDRVLDADFKFLFRGSRHQVKNWLNTRHDLSITQHYQVLIGGDRKYIVSVHNYLTNY